MSGQTADQKDFVELKAPPPYPTQQYGPTTGAHPNPVQQHGPTTGAQLNAGYQPGYPAGHAQYGPPPVFPAVRYAVDSQTNVVMQQGQVVAPDPGSKPFNTLWAAILVTLFCAFPCGVAAIIFSSKANSAWERGDYEEARVSSKKAKNFIIGSILAGIVLIIIVVVRAVFLVQQFNGIDAGTSGT